MTQDAARNRQIDASAGQEREVLSLYAPCGGGGVIQVFRNLRSAAMHYGVRLRWMGCGARAMEAAQRYARPEDLECGEIIGPFLEDEREIASEYLWKIRERRPSLVLIHIMCGRIETNLAAYLPSDIVRIGMVHTITPSTYRGARAMRDHLDAAIGVSPRIRQDLVQRCGFNPAVTVCIPNGVDCQPFLQVERAARTNGALGILSCGRIDDISKGIFWLPEILVRARALKVNFRLTVAGDGPDRKECERRLVSAGLADVIRFLGWVKRENLPALYSQHDVLLFPSRFEGLGLSLVEAMAGGCVPVASRITGATDFVVTHGKTGLLFSPGDTNAAARLIAELAFDPRRRSEMRDRCRAEIPQRFGVDSHARAFLDVVDRVCANPRTEKAPLPVEHWNIAAGVKPAMWTNLPQPVKNAMRLVYERCRG